MLTNSIDSSSIFQGEHLSSFTQSVPTSSQWCIGIERLHIISFSQSVSPISKFSIQVRNKWCVTFTVPEKLNRSRWRAEEIEKGGKTRIGGSIRARATRPSFRTSDPNSNDSIFFFFVTARCHAARRTGP